MFDWDSPENLYLSISYFEKAVEADPDYAMAWGYLASARSVTVLWQATEEASPSTIMAYERALELDPDQSEALAARALMTLLLQRDWETAVSCISERWQYRENSIAMAHMHHST